MRPLLRVMRLSHLFDSLLLCQALFIQQSTSALSTALFCLDTIRSPRPAPKGPPPRCTAAIRPNGRRARGHPVPRHRSKGACLGSRRAGAHPPACKRQSASHSVGSAAVSGLLCEQPRCVPHRPWHRQHCRSMAEECIGPPQPPNCAGGSARAPPSQHSTMPPELLPNACRWGPKHPPGPPQMCPAGSRAPASPGRPPRRAEAGWQQRQLPSRSKAREAVPAGELSTLGKGTSAALHLLELLVTDERV